MSSYHLCWSQPYSYYIYILVELQYSRYEAWYICEREMEILYIYYFIYYTWFEAIVCSNIEENQVEVELIYTELN